MKTAVSIPDDLFREADELALRLGKSRSQIYREALLEYLRRRGHDSVVLAMNDTLASLGEGSGLDRWSGEAARRTLGRCEWE